MRYFGSHVSILSNMEAIRCNLLILVVFIIVSFSLANETKFCILMQTHREIVPRKSWCMCTQMKNSKSNAPTKLNVLCVIFIHTNHMNGLAWRAISLWMKSKVFRAYRSSQLFRFLLELCYLKLNLGSTLSY